jgi:hypothetical protein
MGCNCSKRATATKFVYVSADGKRTVHKSEIEAKAAQVRAGGGGTIKTSS